MADPRGSTDVVDLSPYVGSWIGHTYDGGLIFLSYFVCFVGCWTALELLHRRTSIHGLYNWFLLIAAASTMGAVAIWSMHFVGNQAIIMDVPTLHIDYSPGFTAGSFFLPICGVGIAFYFFSISERVSIVGTLVGGFTVGSAICGMHYMGNGGISNFTPDYLWPFVLASAVIAVAASTVALGIFFYFKSKWTNSWLKRAMCATLLAAAVSGMHWVATAGTRYRLKTDQIQFNDGLSRQATVGVVISLGVGACLTLFVFAIIGQRSRRRSSNRAQQVVLASVTFDADGRLMVTPEGLLPSCKITDAYAGRSFQDVFDINHPVFCWCFRASRCWQGVTNLIPGIRDHLQQNSPFKTPRVRAHSDPRPQGLQASEEAEYSALFKELFLVAANELADTIQEPLAKLGVLFDEIMTTGTVGRLKHSARTLFMTSVPPSAADVDGAERGSSPMTFGRGQVLFTVRQVQKSESIRLQASGYRFASIPNIIDLLARSMEVTRQELNLRLTKMQGYAGIERILEPGVHIGCFALRPLLHRGFEILVEKDAKNMIPTTALQPGRLEQWQLDMLVQMDNWTVATCLEQLPIRTSFLSPKEQNFSHQLLNGIRTLAGQINTPFFQDARLVARPFAAPCRPNGAGSGHATLLAFRILTSVHERTSISHGYEFGSLRFFICQQHTYKDSKDNQIFARKLHREFGGVAERTLVEDSIETPPPRFSFHNSRRSYKQRKADSTTNSKIWPSRVRTIGSRMTMHNTNASSETAVEGSRTSQDILVQAPAQAALGGIHVSSDIKIDVSEMNRQGSGVETEMSNLGYFSEVGLDEELETFAERLVSLTIDERRRVGV